MSSAGEGGAEEGGASPTGELADLDQTIAAYCTAAVTCCAQSGETTMLDGCQTMYAMYQTAIPSIMNGAVTLDAAALARCRAAYDPGPDQCNLNAIIAACSGVYIGHRGEDEPCGSGYDCDRSTGPTTCLITDTANPHALGVCKKIPHAALGEPCATTCRASDEDCSTSTYTSPDYVTVADCFESDGLYCAYEGSTYTCKSMVPLGQPCDSYDSCGSKADCETTCTALADRGEACGAIACLHQYQCGTDSKCVDPTWADSSGCTGYAPGP
jgi:hypothetical protein